MDPRQKRAVESGGGSRHLWGSGGSIYQWPAVFEQVLSETSETREPPRRVLMDGDVKLLPTRSSWVGEAKCLVRLLRAASLLDGEPAESRVTARVLERLRGRLPHPTFSGGVSAEAFSQSSGLFSATPRQRVVPVNPQRWSWLFPYLANMDEEVLLAQETFVL
eukprot:2280317-Amphidinium_carterae.1